MASNVFVINDIDLRIPPEQINVAKEDLTYRWRTLRSRISTKLPSGQGSIDVGVNIPFTNSQLLDLHRLIIQFQQSPFAYIDNKFLRQTIVPNWASSQNMAFTMTGLNLQPREGTSNTWNLQLNMRWFNYFPYTQNYLFRDDWVTNWIEEKDDKGNVVYRQYSIGWELDDLVDTLDPKILHSPTLVNERTEIEGAAKSWDTVMEDFRNADVRTLMDIEQTHQGQVFDLLPLPSKMQPANYVAMPEDSNIYVRYINMLQRDALQKDFGIQAHDDLNRNDLTHYFYSGIKRGETRKVYGLHGDLPEGKPRKRYRELKAKWRKQMLSYSQRVVITYDVYKEFEPPEDIKDKVSELQGLSQQGNSNG